VNLAFRFTVVLWLAWLGLSPQPPAAAAESEIELLAGFWYGENQEEGRSTRRWLVERRMDGTQRITFRTYLNNVRLDEEVTEGTWQYRDGVYYSTYLVVDGIKETIPRQNSYAVVTLNKSEMTYRSQKTGYLFTMKRVDPGFRLP